MVLHLSEKVKMSIRLNIPALRLYSQKKMISALVIFEEAIHRRGLINKSMCYFKAMLTLLLVGICLGWKDIVNHETGIPSPRAYYLSPSGNDKNNGSRNAAFKSIQRLNELQLHPGDSILFEGGNQFKGSLTISFDSLGNQKHPVLISSYGRGLASIYAGNETGVRIFKSKWVFINNLKFQGSGRKKGNLHDGIVIQHCSHVTVNNISISGFQKSGLLINSSEDISATNVNAFENGAAGISVEGRNGVKSSNRRIYIGRCRAENNPGDPSNLTNHSGNGIVVSNCTNVLIEYCTATNNGWDMPRKGNGPVGIWAYEADSVIIQHCLSYRNKTSQGAADGGGFDFDGGVTHSVIQYCLSYENQGAGYCIFQYLYASPWHDNIYRYNISVDDGTVSDAGAGIYVWNSSRDSNQFYNSQVYNNTIYNSKVSAISFSELSERKGFSFYNNIFIATDNFMKGNAGTDVFMANDWWRLGAQTEKELTTGDKKVLNENPDFKNPGKTNLTSASELKDFDFYKISSTSSLRNSGIDLQKLHGLNTGGMDFNSKKAPPTGIGASF
jgi:hypothetical protein